jgi:hypothetical protein
MLWLEVGDEGFRFGIRKAAESLRQSSQSSLIARGATGERRLILYSPVPVVRAEPRDYSRNVSCTCIACSFREHSTPFKTWISQYSSVTKTFITHILQERGRDYGCSAFFTFTCFAKRKHSTSSLSYLLNMLPTDSHSCLE